MPDVPVWFYGDYGCPFSYLVDRRLELLARERSIRVRWRPLALYPEVRHERAGGVGASRDPGRARGSEESAEAALESGGETLESVDEGLRVELRRAAAELGLPLQVPAPEVDTRGALQAAEFARDLGPARFRRLHRALFRALLAEGRDLGARGVLLEVAEEAGVDREALERALEDRRYEPALEEAREEAESYGIQGTPALLFGRFLILGAAPMAELERAAERAEREARPSG